MKGTKKRLLIICVVTLLIATMYQASAGSIYLNKSNNNLVENYEKSNIEFLPRVILVNLEKNNIDTNYNFLTSISGNIARISSVSSVEKVSETNSEPNQINNKEPPNYIGTIHIHWVEGFLGRSIPTFKFTEPANKIFNFSEYGDYVNANFSIKFKITGTHRLKFVRLCYFGIVLDDITENRNWLFNGDYCTLYTMGEEEMTLYWTSVSIKTEHKVKTIEVELKGQGFPPFIPHKGIYTYSIKINPV